MPCAAATAFPSSTRPETSARRSGRSQTRPCVRPVSAPTGFVEALKITLRHCGPRASAHRVRRHPAAGARVGEPLDLGERRRARLERPERRVALHVPLHVARLEDLAGRERRAADHALDVRGEHLLVPDPVLDGRHPAAGERVRGRGDRRIRVHRLRRDDAEVARGQLPGVGRSRAGARAPRPRPRAEPAALIASTCACDASYAHTSTSSSVREVRREQRADRAAADDADPHHVYEASFASDEPVKSGVQRHRRHRAAPPRARGSR